MNNKTKLTIAYIGISVSVLYLIVAAAFIATSSSIFLTGMEIVTIISAPAFLLLIESILADVSKDKIFWRQSALLFISCCMALTVVAHFVNLTVTMPLINKGVDVPEFLQIGQWPSVEMAVDYLAWGFFMGLAFVCTSLAISDNYNMRKLKVTILVCGCLCLIGLMGPVFDIGTLWFISVTGYGLGAPIICIELISLYKELKN
jgi:hypothetical protein